MRTATLVIGLVMGIFLFIGGAAGAACGGVMEGAEEVFGEMDEDLNSATSTTEDVLGAGALAVFVSFILLIGAGLAKAALKTSTAMIIISFLGSIIVVLVDTTSVFAIVYYPAVLVTGICSVLMALAIRRERQGVSDG